MTEALTNPAEAGRRPDPSRTGRIDRIIAAALQTRWLMRLPIPLFRAGFGWLFGDRLVLIEHRGRKTGERRFVVVEVVGREPRALRVASGFGRRAQWYRNIESNGVAFLTVGGHRRTAASARLLDPAASERAVHAYADLHPRAWRHLHAAMVIAQGGVARIPIVEFAPPVGAPGYSSTSPRS
jgi:deazaflavin-dependent oxidoreductase (nitroreductase family)